MNRTTYSFAARAFAFVLSVILVFGLAPLPALAGGSGNAGNAEAAPSAQRTDEDIAASVAEMLSAGSYVEGEAVVCYADSAAPFALPFFPAPAENALLAQSEQLSAVDDQVYADATDEEVPAQDGGLLSFLLPPADNTVNIVLVHEDGVTTEQLLRKLLADPQVLSAEPNYLMASADFAVPGNDGMASDGVAAAGSDQTTRSGGVPDGARVLGYANTEEASQWTIGNSGSDSGSGPDSDQSSGETELDMTGYQWFSTGVEASVPQYLADASNPGMNVPSWNNPSTTNASGVVVIMDTGVDYTHPDLKNVMYHFSPELQQQLGCGEFGYAPRRDDKTDPMDYFGHGTHCAGIAAAQWNSFGVSGVANGAQLAGISIAMSKESSVFSYDAVIKGYDFLVNAAKSGVDIRAVNRSFAPNPSNNADAAMVRAAGEAGIVTCIASGNHSDDLDVICDDISMNQASPYVLRVNASRQQDDRAWFSNYGRFITDVFAPGAGLLSTVPLNAKSHWRYFPEADSNPLYKETAFEDVLPRVYLGDYVVDPQSGKTTLDLNELDVSRSNDIGADGDSASVKFTADVKIGENPMIVIDVPIDESLDVSAIQDISLAWYLHDTEVTDVTLRAMLEDGRFCDLAQDPNAGRSDNSLYGWARPGVHLTDTLLAGQGLRRITEDGVTYIRLYASALFNDPSYEIHTTKAVEMRLDQIAFGRKGNDGNLPYRYMNGTSMATPAVTGCAAVVSSTVEAGSPAERAAETVRILKGAVRQTPGYRDYCKQNGQIDLGILGQPSKYVPVIESAQVTGDLLTVGGAYFGSSAGTMTVGGAAGRPSSWSDSSIALPWPEGVQSGLVPISVKSSTGEALRAFPLSAPASNPASAALYERDLTVPSLRTDRPGITACPTGIAATEEGVLFVAADDGDDRQDPATGHLFRSDDAGATWTSVSLPQDMKNVSLEVGDGVLYVLGSTPVGSIGYVANWHLYSFDIEKGTFEHLRSYDAMNGDEITSYGALAYVNGNLYYVDGEDLGEDGSRVRIRCLDANYVPGEAFYLKHAYPQSAFSNGVKVATSGNSIYACGLTTTPMHDAYVYGLERVDVAADGSLECSDLSAALDGWKGEVEFADAALAAGENGAYLITTKTAGLLPSDASYTDTLFLETGATEFVPYARTLSLGPVNYPAATCAHGQLYAYGVSAYEPTPVFGRATEVVDVHDWSEPAYEWAADNSRVTATRTCGICGKVETETVGTTSAVTKEPAVGAAGVRTYTAQFAATWAQAQTKDVEIPPLNPDDKGGDKGNDKSDNEGGDKNSGAASSSAASSTQVVRTANTQTNTATGTQTQATKAVATADNAPVGAVVAAALCAAMALSLAAFRLRAGTSASKAKHVRR